MTRITREQLPLIILRSIAIIAVVVLSGVLTFMLIFARLANLRELDRKFYVWADYFSGDALGLVIFGLIWGVACGILIMFVLSFDPQKTTEEKRRNHFRIVGAGSVLLAISFLFGIGGQSLNDLIRTISQLDTPIGKFEFATGQIREKKKYTSSAVPSAVVSGKDIVANDHVFSGLTTLIQLPAKINVDIIAIEILSRHRERTNYTISVSSPSNVSELGIFYFGSILGKCLIREYKHSGKNSINPHILSFYSALKQIDLVTKNNSTVKDISPVNSALSASFEGLNNLVNRLEAEKICDGTEIASLLIGLQSQCEPDRNLVTNCNLRKTLLSAIDRRTLVQLPYWAVLKSALLECLDDPRTAISIIDSWIENNENSREVEPWLISRAELEQSSIFERIWKNELSKGQTAYAEVLSDVYGKRVQNALERLKKESFVEKLFLVIGVISPSILQKGQSFSREPQYFSCNNDNIKKLVCQRLDGKALSESKQKECDNKNYYLKNASMIAKVVLSLKSKRVILASYRPEAIDKFLNEGQTLMEQVNDFNYSCDYHRLNGDIADEKEKRLIDDFRAGSAENYAEFLIAKYIWARSVDTISKEDLQLLLGDAIMAEYYALELRSKLFDRSEAQDTTLPSQLEDRLEAAQRSLQIERIKTTISWLKEEKDSI